MLLRINHFLRIQGFLSWNLFLGKRDRIILVTSKLNEEMRLDRIFHGPMKAEAALFFAEQLFSTLDYLHQSHLVHRCLTPQNIYFDIEKRELKIRNWFFWSLSHCGTLAPFDYKTNLKYLAPEDLIKIVTRRNTQRSGSPTFFHFVLSVRFRRLFFFIEAKSVPRIIFYRNESE